MVAAAAVREGRNVVLVDENPWLMSRFPELIQASEIHFMDAADASRLNISADAVIFDAPWYLGDILDWLVAACKLVRPGGTIVFALFPSLVRPTAHTERHLILDMAAKIGRVSVTEDLLWYETPLFEWEALKATGLECIGNWRRGDLVVIRDKKTVSISASSFPRRKDVDGRWHTFIIGSQVVKIRADLKRQYSGSSQTLISEVEGSFILPSVSLRDDRRGKVDVWTSRNRVGVAGAPDALSAILYDLQAGTPLQHAVGPYCSRFGADIEHRMRKFLTGN
jgi:hypothetical protein